MRTKARAAAVNSTSTVGIASALATGGPPLEELAELDLAGLAGYVSDAEKLALLTGASAFLYPSRYEGFGMPVLEAMACGTPVVTSNVSSLPEVAGNAAVLVDPDDLAAMTAGMSELLEDEDLRIRLAGMGLARAAAFTWERTARATAGALHRAGDSARHGDPDG